MQAMENERERLERLYGSFSDDDLVALDPAELTDAGGEALVAEMRRRRLSRQVSITMSTPQVRDAERRLREETFLPTIGDEKDGLIVLCDFSDGLELSKAYTALRERDLKFTLKVHNGDATRNQPAWFAIRVQPEDRLRAEAALRDAMGYFPLQEVEGDVGFVDDGIPVDLGDFESQQEADQVAIWLTDAGIGCKQTKTDEPDEDGILWHTVQVSGGDLERGLAIVAKGLGLG